MSDETTPSWIYGTAWKEEETTRLTQMAVREGFRAIDTANQPRHYQEPLVGEALAKLEQEGISRRTLFLQTKFTPLDGHDHRVPYDSGQTLAAQVDQSFRSSLENLRTDFIDSYLLHGPYSFPGLSDSDFEVWGALEAIYRSGRAGRIGVSNVNHHQLALLLDRAGVKPMVVQNRCFARTGWDREVRTLCRQHGIMYQAFSLLTANAPVLHHPEVGAIAARLGVQPMQVIFRFAIQAEMVPLTGTTQQQHMREDLAVATLELPPEEMSFLESIEG